MLSVSSEFRFSNANAGKVLMLRKKMNYVEQTEIMSLSCLTDSCGVISMQNIYLHTFQLNRFFALEAKKQFIYFLLNSPAIH